MSPAKLHSETHVLDLSSVGDPLLSSAARYTRGLAGLGEQPSKFSSDVNANGTREPSSAAIVLVFLHGLGSHKETWEPTISRLFELERSSREELGPGAPTLVEAWAIDCPDHGETAALNRNSSRVSCLSYGRAVLALLKSSHLARPRSHGCRILLVGHSAGATSLALAAGQVAEQLPPGALAGIVLIEPWMVAADVAGQPAMQKLTRELVQGGASRRDAWNTRAEAHGYLAAHPAFLHWDARTRQLYVDYGLRSLPTSTPASGYPSRDAGVTLAFPKRLESEAYGDFGEGQAALAQMAHVSDTTPLHLVFGAQQPPIVKTMQRSICDHAGRKTASVTYLPGVGHAAPQQSPELVARTIWKIVREPGARELPVSRGKL